MTTLREVAEAIMEQLKGGWVCESDPVAQDLKAALAEPVQRKPLTEEEIDAIMVPLTQNRPYSWREFARAIERAHGIGVKE